MNKIGESYLPSMEISLVLMEMTAPFLAFPGTQFLWRVCVYVWGVQRCGVLPPLSLKLTGDGIEVKGE